MNVDNINPSQTEVHEQEVSFEAFKKERGIYYEKITSDDSFKRIFHVDDYAQSNGMIVSFLNSLLKVEFPKKDLIIRNVKLLGEGINAKTRSANTSISESIGGQSSERPQKLEVDALFSG